jgi:hypothetical protein
MTNGSTLALALAVLLTASSASADTPEASDPDVARCAVALDQQLDAKGYRGRAAARVATYRAQASIDRWEAPFSARNRTRVATLIRVPLQVTYREDKSPSTEALEGRCGFTSGGLLATEIVTAKR